MARADAAPVGEQAGAGWAHSVLVVLLGPRRNPPRPRRFWSFATLIGLVGPGSVPFALVLTAVEMTFLASNYHAAEYAPYIAAVQCGIPVALAGYRPLTAWVITALAITPVALVATPARGEQPWPLIPTALFAYFAVQYGVARAHPRYVGVLTWAATFLIVLGLNVTTPSPMGAPITALVGVFGFAVWIMGDIVRGQLTAQQRLVEEERLTAEERARRQVLEERASVARELHDVVAHHMSVIAVQSSTAAYRIEGLSADVVGEFAEIGEAARSSLAEMRRLLAVLRSDDDDALRVPQPGLAGIAPLAEATTRAGTPVTSHVWDLPWVVPDAVALTAYRVVQEALSNVVRHASGAGTTVDVFGQGTDLVVRVRNDTPPEVRPGVEQAGVGHGLTGMRERVSAVGGKLSAGPRDDGGFGVEAVLPVAASREGG